MTMMTLCRFCAILALLGPFSQPVIVNAQDNSATADSLEIMVEADWSAQERRKNRTPDDPAAVRDAYRSSERLLNDLSRRAEKPDVNFEATILEN